MAAVPNAAIPELAADPEPDNKKFKGLTSCFAPNLKMYPVPATPPDSK